VNGYMAKSYSWGRNLGFSTLHLEKLKFIRRIRFLLAELGLKYGFAWLPYAKGIFCHHSLTTAIGRAIESCTLPIRNNTTAPTACIECMPLWKSGKTVMERTPNLPRLAFVINLGSDATLEPDDNRVRHIAHLFHSHRLPAAWAVFDAKRAKLVSAAQLGLTDNALALMTSHDGNLPAKQFQTKLHNQFAALSRVTGTSISLVLGDAAQLRLQAALLSEKGIAAIISHSSMARASAHAQASSPRHLGCGLWQLTPSLTIPLRSRLWRMLPAQRCTVKQLIAAGENTGTTLVEVNAEELGRGSAHQLQSFEKLLREISWAASHNQLAMVTMSEVVAELDDVRRIKPQRSILRTAA
jgi:hypothetical protein